MPMLRKPRESCLACGSELRKPVNRYCSNACQQEHKYQVYIERWKKGLETGERAKGAAPDRLQLRSSFLLTALPTAGKLSRSAAFTTNCSSESTAVGRMPLKLYMTRSMGPILALGSMFRISRSITLVPLSRTRLMASSLSRFRTAWLQLEAFFCCNHIRYCEYMNTDLYCEQSLQKRSRFDAGCFATI